MQPAYTASTRNASPQIRAVRTLMWLYIASMIMIFAGMTSAYLVRKGEGNWVQFALPGVFIINTILLLGSSLSMHLALRAARANDPQRLQVWLWLTCLLAIGFVFGQFVGWQKLTASGVYLVGEGSGNVSGSFLFVLTGLHALHLVGGIIALVVLLVKAVQYRITADRMEGLRLAATFWHSVDFLWLYLFLFLLVNHL